MLLAAGRGERMRPLTDHCPKPLLLAGGKPLIVWHIERLAAAGFTKLVINHAHLGAQLLDALGNGAKWGVHIQWSPEPEGALETAGGIAQALPLLGSDAPFLVINSDIFCDWDVAKAPQIAAQLGNNSAHLAHLVLVPNPPQHPDGDFVLHGNAVKSEAENEGENKHTFAGIGIYQPQLFAHVPRGSSAKLAPLLRQTMQSAQVRGELHRGRWEDIGTPERLAQLDISLRKHEAA